MFTGSPVPQTNIVDNGTMTKGSNVPWVLYCQVLGSYVARAPGVRVRVDVCRTTDHGLGTLGPENMGMLPITELNTEIQSKMSERGF